MGKSLESDLAQSLGRGLGWRVWDGEGGRAQGGQPKPSGFGR